MRAAIEAFVAAPGPLVLEIGSDHGIVLLSSARAHPGVRWLGCEIRRARVEAAAPHAPDNARLVRVDARTLLASVIPPGRLTGVLVQFPTPSDDPRHLLLTPETVAAVGRALAPEGRLQVVTDVPGMAAWVGDLLRGWPEGEPLPLGPEVSRRERVCRRDGLPVWRFVRRAPPSPAEGTG